MESDNNIAANYQHFRKEGDNLVGKAFRPELHGKKGAHVWAKAAPFTT